MVNLSDRVLSIRTLLQVSDHTHVKDISQLWYLFKRDFFACAVMNLLDACTFFKTIQLMLEIPLSWNENCTIFDPVHLMSSV
jgi:hypothetical protein